MTRLSNVNTSKSLAYGSIILGCTLANPVLASTSLLDMDGISGSYKKKVIENTLKINTPFAQQESLEYLETYSSSIEGFLNYSESNDFLENFFEKLCASQQELGAEFEKVLYDNLWDLYES